MAQTDSNPDKPLKTAHRRPTAAPAPAQAAAQDGPVIGFNELRQACEISALREDLVRLSEDAEALCDHIEDGVEQVRRRVAGLCAEELADPDVMAPLLQFAVGTLISIRDRARNVDLRFGAPDDAERPDWTAAAPQKAAPPKSPPPKSPPAPTTPDRLEAAPAAPVTREPPPPPPPPPREPPRESPRESAAPFAASPLAPASYSPPTRPIAAARPAAPTPARRAAVDGPVDWLGPARK